MATIPVDYSPIHIIAADTNDNVLDFSVCPNKRVTVELPMKATLVITAGTFQFSVDQAVHATKSPSFTVNDVVEIILGPGNNLHFKATTISDAFDIIV